MRVTSSATNTRTRNKRRRKNFIQSEYKHNNGVRVYALPNKIAAQLFGIVDRFEDIWKPTITIPEEDMMRIPLKLGWENQNMFTEAYPLSIKDKEEVDKTFDRLHEPDKVVWSAGPNNSKKDLTPIESLTNIKLLFRYQRTKLSVDTLRRTRHSPLPSSLIEYHSSNAGP
jgi:hypothetical protein